MISRALRSLCVLSPGSWSSTPGTTGRARVHGLPRSYTQATARMYVVLTLLSCQRRACAQPVHTSLPSITLDSRPVPFPSAARPHSVGERREERDCPLDAVRGEGLDILVEVAGARLLGWELHHQHKVG